MLTVSGGPPKLIGNPDWLVFRGLTKKDQQLMQAIAYIAAMAAVAYMLAGCAGTPVPPSQLEKPSARLLVAPERLSEVKAGDDTYQVAAVCRASYSEVTGKLVGLQRYVRTVTK